ncbi:MAG: hypothetical protein EOL97_13225 [Spirochaetia bacterium]|nr:hypothetical protein [Spirochaetia bacterium]
MDKSKNNDIVVIFVLIYIVLLLIFLILNEALALGFVFGIYFIFSCLCIYERLDKKNGKNNKGNQ